MICARHHAAVHLLPAEREPCRRAAGLTRAKAGRRRRWKNALRRGELHRTEEIETGIKTMLLNIREALPFPSPRSCPPALAAMGGDQASIFDELKHAIDETLEELRDFNVAFAQEEDGDGEKKKNKGPMRGAACGSCGQARVRRCCAPSLYASAPSMSGCCGARRSRTMKKKAPDD